MEHAQIEKTNMYDKMYIFFEDATYSSELKAFQRIYDEITKFKTNKATLATYIQQHQADTKGVTQTKNNAFNAMITLVVKVSQKAYVWSLDGSNQKLAGIFDVQISTFTRGTETKAYTVAKNIRDALAANIESMKSVELTAADVTAINAAITAYEAVMGTTGAVQSHKTAGTQGIVDMQKKLDANLDIIDTLMVSHYKDSNSDMVKEYLLNRTIEKLPTHHSGMSVHVTDSASGADLQGAVLAINGKTSTTDIDGDAEIIKIKPDTYNAVISLAGYASQTTKVVIERSKVTELEVKLVKA